jgi:PAS domain S-box-containing protein
MKNWYDGGENQQNNPDLSSNDIISSQNTKSYYEVNRRISQIIDFLPDPTFAIDDKGKVIFWNRPMEELTGVTSRNILEKSNYEYALPFYGKCEPILIDLVLKGDDAAEKKYTSLRKDGESIYAEAMSLTDKRLLWGKASPMRDDYGMVIGAIESIRDVTERKGIEQAHKDAIKQIDQFFDFLPDPAFAINLEGKVILWNNAFERITGIKSQDILGAGNYEYSIPFYGERRPALVDLVLNPDLVKEGYYSNLTLTNGIITFEGAIELTLMGEKRYFWGKASPIYDSQGEMVGAIETLRDLTDRKIMEDTLSESEARYRDIFLNVSDLIYLHDLEGNFIEANTAAQKSTGYSEDEVRHLNVMNLLREDRKGGHKEYLARLIEKGHDEGIITICAKNGIERNLEYRNSLIRNSEGRPMGVRGSARDITSRIATQKQLIRERDFCLSLIETSPIFFVAIGPQGESLYMNRSMLHALGYTLDEVLGKPYVETFVPIEDRAELYKVRRGIQDSHQPIVHANRVVTRNGSTLDVQWRGAPIFNDKGEYEFLFAMGIDITEHKLANQALQQSEKKFRFLTEKMNDMIWTSDLNLQITYVSPSVEKIFGFTPGERINTKPNEWMTSESHSKVLALLNAELLREGEDGVDPERVVTVELENYHKNGSTVWAENVVSFIRDKDGTIVGLHGVSRDITERKRAEEELQESEIRYRQLIEQAEDGIFVLDQNGNYLLVNSMFCEMLGYTEGELLKLNVLDTYPEELKDIGRARFARVASGESLRVERTMKRKNGTIFYVELSVSKFNDIRLQGIIHDITDRKNAEEEKRRLENQLIQSQKMEALGTLAGGIAHDFNNILSAVIGFSELAREELQPGNQTREKIVEVLKASDRAQDLVKQILTFSRKVDVKPKPLAVYIIVKEVIKLLRSSIPSTILINQDIDPSSGLILADPTQIHQVIVNLCTNAYHAMQKSGGTLTISLGQEALNDGSSLVHPDLNAGVYVKLSVKDTGCGMDEATMQRIFDPFFTTKEMGQGTGLGLAIVHGIIKKLGGAILVSSTSGVGSTFEVFFPKFSIDIEECADDSDMTPEGNGERILFVDDEIAIAEFAKIMLEQIGYSVSSYPSSMEALNSFCNNPGGFDLVITDQTMPGMRGDQLVLEILKIRHDMPIIVISGYCDMLDTQTASSLGIKELVGKPFSRKTIAQAIHRVLNLVG